MLTHTHTHSGILTHMYSHPFKVKKRGREKEKRSSDLRKPLKGRRKGKRQLGAEATIENKERKT